MNISRHPYTLCVLLGFFCLLTRVQGTVPTDNLTPGEPICVSYTFSKGDTLVYRLVAFDSIIFPGRPALFQKREEIQLYICDSMGGSGRAFLSAIQTDLRSEAFDSDGKKMQSQKSPWIGVRNWVEMDKFGTRYTVGGAAQKYSLVSPGGLFHPVPLVYLGDSCAPGIKSYFAKARNQVFVENSVPPPVVDVSVLSRYLGRKDTLGRSTVFYRVNLNGRGIMMVRDQRQDSLVTTSVMNHVTEMDYDPTLSLPIHLWFTQETKLKIEKLGSTREGTHYVTGNYTLVRYRSAERGLAYNLEVKARPTSKKGEQKRSAKGKNKRNR